jgi:hypothetical protein
MAVTPEQVADVARRYLPPERFTLVVLGPAEGGPMTTRDWEVAVQPTSIPGPGGSEPDVERTRAEHRGPPPVGDPGERSAPGIETRHAR